MVLCDGGWQMKLHGYQIGAIAFGLWCWIFPRAQTLSKTGETAIPTAVTAVPGTLNHEEQPVKAYQQYDH